MTTQVLTDPTVAAIRSLVDHSLEDQSSKLEYQNLGYTDFEPDLPAEQVNAWSGTDQAVLTVEGQEYGDTQRYRDYPATCNLRKYTSKLSWSDEEIHWLNKGNESKRINRVKSIAANAVNGLQYPVDDDAARMLYLGFGVTFFTGGDGLAIFSASHTLRKSGSSTQSNMFSDNHWAFDGNRLTTAIEIMNRFRGHNNIQLKPVKRLLLVGTNENADTMDRTLASDYGPDTANLGVNPGSEKTIRRRGMQISYFTSSYIPAARSGYWFLIDLDRAADRHFMAWAWKPKMNEVPEQHNGTTEYLGSVFMGPVVLGFQHLFGSLGTGAAV